MTHDDNDRPLSGISSAELALRLERLRGEMWKELTRLDGEMSMVESDVERRWTEYQRSLTLAEKELARRLDELNHAHAKAREVLNTYIPRDVYERDKKEGESRLSFLEVGAANLAGRLWLPMVILTALISAAAALAVKYLLP